MPSNERWYSNSYVIGFAATLLALAAHMLLRLVDPASPHLLLFLVAIIAAAWKGDWCAGACATLLAVVLSRFLLADSSLDSTSGTIRQLLLLFVGVVTSISIASLRRRERRAWTEINRQREYLRSLVTDQNEKLDQASAQLMNRILELERTQAELEEYTSRFSGIVTSMADAVITVNADQQVVLFNPAAEDMFGLSAERALGSPLDRFIPLRYRDHHRELVRRFGGAGESRRRSGESISVSALRANGEEFPVEASISATASGPNQLLTVVLRDITERQIAETAMQKQLVLQDQLAKVAASVPGVIYSFLQDSLGHQSMPYCSAAFETVFDLNPAAVRKDIQPLFERIIPEDLEHLKQGIQDSARSLTMWHDCVRYRHPRAGLVWLEGHSIPQRQADGSTLWHGYIQDVTDRMHTDSVLKLSEERFRRLVEATGAMVWTTNAEGVPNSDSPSWRDFTGYTLEQLMNGWQWLEAFHPEDRDRIATVRRDSLKNRTLYEIEARLRHHSGEYRHIFGRAVPLLNPDGSVREWVGMDSDISARVDAQDKVKESEMRFRGIFNGTYEFVGLTSPDGTLLEANRSALEFIGMNAGDVLGQPFWATPWWSHDPATQERVRNALLQAVRGETVRFETQQVGKGDQIEIVDFFLHPVFDEHGKVTYIVPEGRRITELKKTQQQLMEQAQQLRDADRNKDEFIAMLSHEIRNPLSAISNAAAVLHRLKSQDDNLHRAESIITQQLQQLNRLVGDLLDVSRMSHGKFTLSKARCSVTELISQAVTMSRALIGDLRHNLHVELPQETLFIDADPARIVQVIDNLLHNAAKYTSPGGHIWLKAYRQQNDLIVLVRDDGIGITEDLLPHVFEPFRQGRSAAPHSASGLGLGLNLAQRLVELHDGQLTVQSEGVNRGAEFCVRLPLVLESVASVSEVSQPKADEGSAEQKVLIIDDEPAVAESLAMLLSVMGYPSHIVNDGHQAVSAVDAYKPDVVLLDIGLPGISGYEVLKLIKAEDRNRNLPVVALSGYGQPQDLAKSAAAGFTKHLVKPIEPDDLEALLQSLSRPLGSPLL